MGGNFAQPLIKIKFPPNLKHLVFNGRFDQLLSRVKLPDSLKTLELCGKYNKTVERINFPPSLKKIVFGEKYEKSLNNIQCGVKELVFYKIKHDISNLPISVKKIKLMADDLLTKITKIPHGCIIVNINDVILKSNA